MKKGTYVDDVSAWINKSTGEKIYDCHFYPGVEWKPYPPRPKDVPLQTYTDGWIDNTSFWILTIATSLAGLFWIAVIFWMAWMEIHK